MGMIPFYEVNMNFYTKEQSLRLETLGFTLHHRWFIHDHIEIKVIPLSDEFGVDCGDGLEIISTFEDCIEHITIVLDQHLYPCIVTDEEFIQCMIEMSKMRKLENEG
tara:strand:+ start:206 stop:526 length:321 start_codon:yes stop_codon:yes gene_type:complete